VGRTIYGTTADDIIYGNGGDDFIDGGGSGQHDLLYGGEGNDIIRIYPAGGTRPDPWSLADGGNGFDIAEMSFSNFGDSLTYVHNNVSSDITCGRLAGRLVSIEAIRFSASFVSDNITGGANNDWLIGNGGDDILNGGGGDDELIGGPGNDTIEGGEGNDSFYLTSGGGTDVYRGGNGSDWVVMNTVAPIQVAWQGGTGVTLSLATTSAQAIVGGSVQLFDIENILGSQFADSLRGSAADNTLNGAGGDDTLDLADGGSDTAIGGAGNDVFYMGGALSAGDSLNGGDGTDTLVLQGNYAGLTLAAGHLTGIEGISIQSGSVTKWRPDNGSRFDYNLASVNANVASGQQMRVNAQSLLAGEDLTFDGSAETDGRFLFYGGFGADVLTGGTGNDVFFFEAGRLGAGDVARGGDGNDAVVVSGAPSGTAVLAVTIEAGALSSIESLSFNGRFASDPAARPGYAATLKNGNIAAGGTLIVNGSSLEASQGLDFDGSQVADGRLRIFGGAGGDTLRGGALDDVIYAAGGGDLLIGGAGADVFQYRSIGDSQGVACDLIGDFQLSLDKIDLGQIDANINAGGDQAFTFIGTAAFSSVAGQLRYSYDSTSNLFTIQGDVNGDGVTDFQLYASPTTPGAPLQATDFAL
jgi:Ca2+-binding RTX toxin-like protein